MRKSATSTCLAFIGLVPGALLFSGILAWPAAADCNSLPDHAKLEQALKASVKPSGGPSNGGFDVNMWATVVDRDGFVCQVVFSGKDRGDQFPASRVVSAQKANTANGLSLDGLALSTANLFSAVQPGHSLFGLQESNPVDTAVAYGGNPEDYGKANDPMVGKRIGGVNVFGGGVALYSAGKVVGGVGVSGDSSCADHNIAWRIRKALALDAVPGGVSANHNDAMIYDVDANGVSKSGWGHPGCGGTEADVAVSLGAGIK
jgi:uncharacterized protein GlcG (DUF336 family)